MKTTISLIRHGNVENPHDIYYGRLPHYGLSVLGRTQAEAAARLLKDIPLSALYSSPLLRARQTARIIQRYHPELRVRISSLLFEVHTPYDGSLRADLFKRKWDVYAGTAAPYEQPEDVLRRMLHFAKKVLRDYPGQHVAAVTHGDVVAFFSMWAQGRPVINKGKARLYPATGSISTFVFEKPLPSRPGYSYLEPESPAQ